MNRPVRTATVLALLLAAAAATSAQVYREIDRSGRVVFTDQPPSARAAAAAPVGGGSAVNTGDANADLPYALRQVVQRYPVTLYTSADCAPCDAGRSLLTTRGVPFQERSIVSAEDSKALQQLSGKGTVPLLAIGKQQLDGFSDAQWSQYLDAAGYPKSNQLPRGYANAPARPLVALQAAPAAPTAEADAPRARERESAPPPPVQGPTPSNPAGIRF